MEKVLSLEEDFLLTLMEFEINHAKKEKIIELINQGIDWPKIISFAKASGLAPLFYKNFQNLNIIEFIPEDLINKFSNKLKISSNALFNLIFFLFPYKIILSGCLFLNKL